MVCSTSLRIISLLLLGLGKTAKVCSEVIKAILLAGVSHNVKVSNEFCEFELFVFHFD